MKRSHVVLALGGLAVAGWAFYVFTRAHLAGRPWLDVARVELARYGWEAALLLIAATSLGLQAVGR